MTRDEIISMAREVWSAGDTYIGPSISSLSEFAARVAAAEREACAKVCLEVKQSKPLSDRVGWEHGTVDCAAAIRARGEE